MSCRIVKKVCKTEGETKPWGFDYAGYDQDSGTWGFLSRVWAPGAVYGTDETVRPSLPTGLQYVSTAGQSGAFEPRWPTTIGGTVTDGSITWTAEAISNDSLLTTISSSDWLADDSDLTVDGEVLVNTSGAQVATVHVSGGVTGNEYEVTNTIILADGSVEESRLLVTVA